MTRYFAYYIYVSYVEIANLAICNVFSDRLLHTKVACNFKSDGYKYLVLCQSIRMQVNQAGCIVDNVKEGIIITGQKTMQTRREKKKYRMGRIRNKIGLRSKGGKYSKGDYRSRLQLEVLDLRLLLSASPISTTQLTSANQQGSDGYIADFIGPDYNIPADFYARQHSWTDAETTITSRIDTLEDNYSLPCVISSPGQNTDLSSSISDNRHNALPTNGHDEHLFTCNDPVDLGLITNSLQTSSPDSAYHSNKGYTHNHTDNHANIYASDYVNNYNGNGITNPSYTNKLSAELYSNTYSNQPAGTDQQPTEAYYPEYKTSNGNYVLYLDFTGASVSSRQGDFWLGSSSVQIPKYSLSKFGWSGREQESINYITQFVQEDYSAYNIVVTNHQPSGGAYTTIYVGGSNQWFRSDSSIVGVATYDPGNSNPDNYGFAFTDNMDIYHDYSHGSVQRFSEYVANLISHEAGHTFGLNHVSDTTAIMNPYLPIQPHRLMFGCGNVPGSNKVQDSQSVLGNNLGYAHGPDDYGNDYQHSHKINANITIAGQLERRDDIDAFRFHSSQKGQTTVTVTTPLCGNLDPVIGVYNLNNNMSLIATNDNIGYVSSSTNTGNTGSIDNTGNTNNFVNTTDSMVQFNTAPDTDYVIYVSSSQAHSSGSYSLSLSSQDTAPHIDLSHTTGFISSNSGSIIDFGVLQRGQTVTRNLVIQNNGHSQLIINDIEVTQPFAISGYNGSTIIIAAGQEASFPVTLSSTVRGNINQTIRISSNDATDAVTTLVARAKVTGGVLTIHETSGIPDDNRIDFGTVFENSKAIENITLSNTGDANLSIKDISISKGFNLLEPANTSGGIILTPGKSIQLQVIYTPTRVENVSGNIVIHTNNIAAPVSTIAISATGRTNALGIDELDGINDGHNYAGRVKTGSVYTIGIWHLVNNDSIPVTVRFAWANGRDFHLTGPDTLTIPAGGNLPINVNLKTSSPTHIADTLSVFAGNSSTSLANIVIEAKGYTVLGAAQKQLKFITNTGNTVKIRVTGDTRTEITLGGAGEPDIESIQFVNDANTIGNTNISTNTNNNANNSPDTNRQQENPVVNKTKDGQLSIKVSGGGTTTIGNITGNAFLKGINAPGAILTGTGINLDGRLSRLRLFSLNTDSSISFATGTSPAILQIPRVAGNIDIDGGLRLLRTNSLRGKLRIDYADKLQLGRFTGQINADKGDIKNITLRYGDMEGDINVAGNLGSLKIKQGDLLGKLTVKNEIGYINLTRGTIRGDVKTDGIIKNIRADNINSSNIAAGQGIQRISISNDMLDSVITVGLNMPVVGNSTYQTQLSDTFIDSINVRGIYSGSVIAVGVVPDQNGNYLQGHPVSEYSYIGRLNLAKVNTNNQNRPFGVITKNITDKLLVNQQYITGNFHQDDFYIYAS